VSKNSYGCQGYGCGNLLGSKNAVYNHLTNKHPDHMLVRRLAVFCCKCHRRFEHNIMLNFVLTLILGIKIGGQHLPVGAKILMTNKMRKYKSQMIGVGWTPHLCTV
jgi:hypothetical protein